MVKKNFYGINYSNNGVHSSYGIAARWMRTVNFSFKIVIIVLSTQSFEISDFFLNRILVENRYQQRCNLETSFYLFLESGTFIFEHIFSFLWYYNFVIMNHKLWVIIKLRYKAETVMKVVLFDFYNYYQIVEM